MDRHSLGNIRNKIEHTGARAKIFHKNWWIKKYKSVSEKLRITKNTVVAVLTRPKRNGLSASTTQEKLRNSFIVADNAFEFKFPKKFIASEGVNFESLLVACYLDVRNKDSTRPEFRIRLSSLELWSFIVANRHKPYHIAYKFRKYTEEQVRFLPLNWLNIDPVPHALAKAILSYGGLNSEEHSLTFKEIGYEPDNIVDWLSIILEKMCCSTISTFELFPKTGINTSSGVNISYNIAAEVLNLNNQFQTNVVNQVIVISYSPRSLTSTDYLTTGKLVTTYIIQGPILQYIEDCILKPALNTLPWGGSINVFSNYLNLFGANGLPAVGATGLPIITVNPFFPVLETERGNGLTDANKVEDHYNKQGLKKIPRGTSKGIADIEAISKGYRLMAGVQLSPKRNEIYRRLKHFVNELKNL